MSSRIRNDHVRELEVKRSAKRYANKKEEINARRREQYAIRMNKVVVNSVVNPVVNPVVNSVENPAVIRLEKPVVIEVENPVVIEVDNQVSKGTYEVKSIKKKPTKNDLLIEKLEKLDLNLHTKKKYLGDLNRVLNLINNEDLLTNIRNLNILQKIKETTSYATSTKLGLIQILLFMITNFKLVVNKKAITTLKNNFELLKNTINTEHKVKISDPENSIMNFTDYIENIKKTFGENSKMYVLTRLYNEVTLRDDFVLKIVDKTPKENNESNSACGRFGEQEGHTPLNYIVLLKSQLVLIINTYKTQTAYGQIKIKLSKALSNLIKKYIIENKLNINDYLFGDQKLSDYVRYNNSKINVEGGISNFRKMKISEELSKNISDEEKIILAEKMKHSPLVQLNYIRNLK